VCDDAERQEYARSHPLRVMILALIVQGGGVRSLDPEDLRQELPKHPAVAVIEYHLRVLRDAKLLPA